MKVISINVGVPREMPWHGQTVITSIFKSPLSEPVIARHLNIDGDRQSDLTVHGGVDKAVYVYPAEHYPAWRAELANAELAYGAFGENLTTEGLHEDTLQIGDRLQIGSAEFVVTQPRLPCFKLGLRFQRADIEKRFLDSGRTGFYLRVSQEGTIAPGDEIQITRQANSLSIRQLIQLYTAAHADPELVRRASELADLPVGWRDHFRKALRTSHGS